MGRCVSGWHANIADKAVEEDQWRKILALIKLAQV